MLDTKKLIAASLETLEQSLRPAARDDSSAASSRVPTLAVPIRSLGVNHRERIADHLLALDSQDRFLRFGYAASDEQIRRYIAKLDFERDEIFGIYNRRLALIAVAHLAFLTDGSLQSCAEFGVSVSAKARGRGYGTRLFDRAAMHARNEGVSVMFIHALSENVAMLKIARQAGATVERDGAEAEAHLRLRPATLDTQLVELLEEQVAQADYRLKSQMKYFDELLGGQLSRCGVSPRPSRPSNLV